MRLWEGENSLLWKYAAVAAGSYAVGSLSLSILTSKLFFGGDIRAKGSGNAGATNMARVHGWGAGLLTLAGDALKAAACMLGGKALAGEIGLCIGAGACMLAVPWLQGRQGHRGRRCGRLRDRLARRRQHGRVFPPGIAAVQEGLCRLPVRGCRHRGVLVPFPRQHAAADPVHFLRVPCRCPPHPQHQTPGRGDRARLQSRQRKIKKSGKR